MLLVLPSNFSPIEFYVRIQCNDWQGLETKNKKDVHTWASESGDHPSVTFTDLNISKMRNKGQTSLNLQHRATTVLASQHWCPLLLCCACSSICALYQGEISWSANNFPSWHTSPTHSEGTGQDVARALSATEAAIYGCAGRRNH